MVVVLVVGHSSALLCSNCNKGYHLGQAWRLFHLALGRRHIKLSATFDTFAAVSYCRTTLLSAGASTNRSRKPSPKRLMLVQVCRMTFSADLLARHPHCAGTCSRLRRHYRGRWDRPGFPCLPCGASRTKFRLGSFVLYLGTSLYAGLLLSLL